MADLNLAPICERCGVGIPDLTGKPQSHYLCPECRKTWCAVCGDNSGWIADPTYGWVQCANCNDERTKPKPPVPPFLTGQCLGLPEPAEGQCCWRVGGQVIPVKSNCPHRTPTFTFGWTGHVFGKGAQADLSSRLEFPEFTNDDDFFDAAGQEGLNV